jgi:hypothetical protein
MRVTDMTPLCQFRERQVETLDGGSGAISMPDHAGVSICDVVPAIAGSLTRNDALGDAIGRRASTRLLKEQLIQGGSDVKGLLLVIVDSVSAAHLQRVLTTKDIFGCSIRTTLNTISSIFPTITQACLPSIWAGAPPSVHGVFGRFFFIPEIGKTSGPIFDQPDRLDDTLYEAPDLYTGGRSKEALRIPSWAGVLPSLGVHVSVFVSAAKQPFTGLVYGDTPVTTGANAPRNSQDALERILSANTSRVDSDRDLLDRVCSFALSGSSGKSSAVHRDLVVVHLLAVGSVGNSHCVDDPEFINVVSPLWFSVGELVSALVCTGNWLAVVTSDHGMIEMVKGASGSIGDSALQAIRDLSYADPACNQRCCYLYPTSQESAVHMSDILGNELPSSQFAIIQHDDEMRRDLYGTGGPGAYALRPGPLLLLNVGGGNFTLPWEPRYKSAKLSDHGGLTRVELEVPLVVCAG